MRPVRALSLAALLVVLAHAGQARAEADTFGLGSGHDGPLNVTSVAGQVINTYAPVTADISAGATSITVGARSGAATTFDAGQLVMIVQSRGGFTTAPTSGVTTAIALTAADKTGRYELARIATANLGALTLTHPTENAYDANDTQLVSVPEYTSVTITANAKLTALPWSAATGSGGVLAFLSTGVLSNAGSLDVSTAGFAGGAHIQTTTATGCAAEDGTPVGGGAAAGGAHKGEGLDPTAFDTSTTYAGAVAHVFGRGNVANAGGGGDCFNSGGGGGGHGSAGGAGGMTNPDTDISRAVGGRGGAMMTYDPGATLVFGGGGGAGEDDDGVGGHGGAGGGVMWLRADSLTGPGTLDADGEAGANAGAAVVLIYSDGGGGGGAGGGVFASFKGDATCGGIRARGGKGGNAIPTVPGRQYGPGGGGAGGRVRVESGSGTCSAIVTPGASGTTSNAATFGATAGGTGASATGASFTGTCDFTTGKCGGCVSSAYCPASAPTCITAAGPDQYTCTGGSSSGDGGADGGDGGSSSGSSSSSSGDGGSSGTSGTSGGISGENPSSTEGVSLEGGGISCNTAPASTSSVLTLAGLSGLVALAVRRKRRRQ